MVLADGYKLLRYSTVTRYTGIEYTQRLYQKIEIVKGRTLLSFILQVEAVGQYYSEGHNLWTSSVIRDESEAYYRYSRLHPMLINTVVESHNSSSNLSDAERINSVLDTVFEDTTSRPSDKVVPHHGLNPSIRKFLME